MNRPLYEYRCGTCRSTELVIRPKEPGGIVHPNCFLMWCSNGHQLVGTPTEYQLHGDHGEGALEFRTNRPRRPR
jgi:hypothetical protein